MIYSTILLPSDVLMYVIVQDYHVMQNDADCITVYYMHRNQ